MLRVTTLYASSAVATAAYYTRYLADAPGEEPGRWLGRQADGLGLAGAVEADDLQRLLEGRDPTSGLSLGRELQDRTDCGWPGREGGGWVRRHLLGSKVAVTCGGRSPATLACSKLTTSPSTAALEHLERYGATTRIRHQGRRLHPDTLGLTMATFRQTTSRADDPQLHTHAVISAKVQTDDGRWLALDARFLKRHQRMLGGLYQSVLRAELTHRYGIVWEPVVNGQAEIAGAPAELLEVFSKRTVQVDAALAGQGRRVPSREGRDPSRWERAAMEREAAADTRPARPAGRSPICSIVGGTKPGSWAGPPSGSPQVSPSQRSEQPAADAGDGRGGPRSAVHHRLHVDPGRRHASRLRHRIGADRLSGLEWARVLERVTDDVLGQLREPRPRQRSVDGASRTAGRCGRSQPAPTGRPRRSWPRRNGS